MLERSTNLPPEEAYNKLREIALKEKCKIVEEDPPKSIVVEQGSSLEYSPRTFKKIIKFDLIPEDAGTRILSDTYWTSSRIVEAVLTPVITGIIAVILWGLILNMEIYLGGLVAILGTLIAILVVVTIFEIIVVIYSYTKRETVAERFLRLLPG